LGSYEEGLGWRPSNNREIKKDVFGKFANETYSVSVGIQYRNDLDKWYYKNHGWYQGCLFIKNPLYKTMTLDDFKILLNKIVLKLGFDKEEKKYFKGNCYGELLVKIADFMDGLMTVLGEETQNQNWSYEETNGYKTGFGKLKERFEIIDEKILQMCTQ
jgi:hypothetical protein